MNDAELKAAILAAPAGSTVTVPPGRYVDIRAIHVKRDVTIQFEPGAVVRSLDFGYAPGLRLQKPVVEFIPNETTRTHVVGIRLVESAGVTVEGARVVGAPAIWGVPEDAPAGAQAKTGGSVIGWPMGTGISGYHTPGLTIVDSDVSKFFRGVMIANSPDCRVELNHVHDTRSTPIAFADADRIVIDRNLLGPLRPWKHSGAGDHADGIHGWVEDDQLKDGVWRPTVGVRITRNLYDQGDGAAPIGIYLDDNALDVGFVDTLIEGNVILNSDGQGIRLEAVAGTVRGNVLLRTSDATGTGAPGLVLFGQKGRVLTVEGNTLADKALGTDDRRLASVAFPSNRYVPATVDAAAVSAARAAWMAQHRPQKADALAARVTELEAALAEAREGATAAVALAEERLARIEALEAQIAAARAALA